MNHRERRNFRGKKNKNRTFGSPHPRSNFHVQLHELPHPQSSGHPCSEAVPQCPSCFGSRTRLEQIEKKSSPGHPHWTWPDHPMGTETGRWQKQKFKQKRQAVSRQLQPFSELGRHPIWKRHGTLVGSGFLAWLRGGSWGWAGWAVDILDTGRFLVDSGCTGRTTFKQLSKLYVCVGSSPSLQQGVNVPQ